MLLVTILQIATNVFASNQICQLNMARYDDLVKQSREWDHKLAMFEDAVSSYKQLCPRSQVARDGARNQADVFGLPSGNQYNQLVENLYSEQQEIAQGWGFNKLTEPSQPLNVKTSCETQTGKFLQPPFKARHLNNVCRI